MQIPKKYIPKRLSKIDKKTQAKQIKLTRNLYKKGKYLMRKKLYSFTSKRSKHIVNAEKIYNLSKFKIDKHLVKATGCTKKSLEKIVKKGQGAFYSSGSRPNQTAHSWGYARLASALTAGKAATIDYNILEEGCGKNSKALKLAKMARKKYGTKTRRVQKYNV